jgi:hypothetical protein
MACLVSLGVQTWVKKCGYPVSLQGWSLDGLGVKEIDHWEAVVRKNVVVGQSLDIFAERGLRKKWRASARIVRSFPFHSSVGSTFPDESD